MRPVPAAAAVLLAAALALTGCSAGSGSDDSSGSKAGAAAPADGERGAAGSAADRSVPSAPDAPGAPSAPPKTAASHIIRTASLTVQVKDVPKALDAARATAENAGGYIGDETTSRDEDGHERTRLVLRVPVDAYQDVLSELEGAGKLLQRNAKAEDVTDQVVDVESRIASQRASVARVRELMDRATKLSDVVTLEGELSTRQAELEALLARQASLKDRTSLATITLSLSANPVKDTAGEDDGPGFADALKGGWDAFVTVLRWVVVVCAAVLPFAAVAALLALLWLRVVRPRLPRRPSPAVPSAPAAPPAAVPGSLPAAPPVPAPGRGEEPGGRD